MPTVGGETRVLVAAFRPRAGEAKEMAEGPLGSERGAREPDRGAGYERGGQGGYYGTPAARGAGDQLN